MAVKTITVTEDAYNTLKAMKKDEESFSDAILRIGKRRPLSDFFGVLGKESGERFEKAIMDARKRRNASHQKRIKRIREELSG